MRKSISIFLFLIFILSINLFSQVNEEWVRIYNGEGYNNMPSAMVVDSAGNVYVTGYSGTTYGVDNYDYVIVGYNTNGTELFETRFNGHGGLIDIPYAMCYDGNYLYVTGLSKYNASITAALTLKLNLNGQVIWAKYCINSGSRVTEGDVISTDNAGNVYVAGMRGGGGLAFYLKIIKYSYAGDTIWVNTYPDRFVNTDNPIGMKTDALGNVYVSASCSGNFSSTWNITTLKYNTNGQLMWVRLYDSTSIIADAFRGMSTDQYGNSVVMGYRQVTWGSHIVIIYYDQNGQELRSFLYPSNPGGFYFPKDIYADNYNNLYITGTLDSILPQFITLKYNSNYILQWVRKYSAYTIYDQAAAVIADRLGNVYVTGRSKHDPPTLAEDYATIKYNSSGILQWNARYNGPIDSYDRPIAIGIDENYNMYVTGSSNVTGTKNNFATIKYSQIIGIRPISSEVPNKFSLFQNYPNPFNPVTKIKFDIPTPLNPPFTKGGTAKPGGFARLVVYDVLGKEIAVLVNEQLSPATYEVEWDGSNYPSGVYFYRLTADNFVETNRMVLIK